MFESVKIDRQPLRALTPASTASGEKRAASMMPKSPTVWIIRRTIRHWPGPNGCAGASLSMISIERASISGPLIGASRKARISGRGGVSFMVCLPIG
jgi:hypothetical protein